MAIKKRRIYLLAIIIIGIPIFIYSNQYGVFILKENPANLGAWGDFINPWIALVNVILLVYLTFEVKNIEARRLQQTFDAQKDITLTQIRNEEIRALIKELNKIELFEYAQTLDNILGRTIEIRTTLFNFRNNSYYLFESEISQYDFDTRLGEISHSLICIEDDAFTKDDLNKSITTVNIDYKSHLEKMEGYPDKMDETYKGYEIQLKDISEQRKTLYNNWVKFQKSNRITQINFLNQKDFLLKMLKDCVINSLDTKKNKTE